MFFRLVEGRHASASCDFGLIAVAGTLASMPVGCGAAQDEVAVVREPASSAGQWTVPESVIGELQTCVKTHVRDLRTYAHEARFYATVTEDGGIQRIKMHSSTLHHGELESCMMRALTALPIPSSVFRMRATMSVSGGESMRHSREPLGVVNTAGALVTLGPIIILAAGVTLGVYIIPRFERQFAEQPSSKSYCRV